MILMSIINKDYYLQLIRNKKTFQLLNRLRSNRLVPSLHPVDLNVQSLAKNLRVFIKNFTSKFSPLLSLLIFFRPENDLSLTSEIKNV